VDTHAKQHGQRRNGVHARRWTRAHPCTIHLRVLCCVTPPVLLSLPTVRCAGQPRPCPTHWPPLLFARICATDPLLLCCLGCGHGGLLRWKGLHRTEQLKAKKTKGNKKNCLPQTSRAAQLTGGERDTHSTERHHSAEHGASDLGAAAARVRGPPLVGARSLALRRRAVLRRLRNCRMRSALFNRVSLNSPACVHCS
jgi:hypothetical protein